MLLTHVLKTMNCERWQAITVSLLLAHPVLMLAYQANVFCIFYVSKSKQRWTLEWHKDESFNKRAAYIVIPQKYSRISIMIMAVIVIQTGRCVLGGQGPLTHRNTRYSHDKYFLLSPKTSNRCRHLHVISYMLENRMLPLLFQTILL